MRSYIWSRWGAAVGGVVVIVAVIWTDALTLLLTPSYQQPRPYNHKQHLEAKDWKCPTCHIYAHRETFAGYPPIKDCVECHDTEIEEDDMERLDTAELEALRQIMERGEEIPWVQVHRVPSYVFFSHRLHVEIGEIECIECHGDMNQLTEAFTRPEVPIRMNDCIDCHIEEEVTIDCLSCHR